MWNQCPTLQISNVYSAYKLHFGTLSCLNGAMITSVTKSVIRPLRKECLGYKACHSHKAEYLGVSTEWINLRIIPS